MPALNHPNKRQPVVSSRIRNMTPYEIYKLQVGTIMNNLRVTRRNLTYFPPQVGGLDGQRDTIRERVALQLIDFEVSSGN